MYYPSHSVIKRQFTENFSSSSSSSTNCMRLKASTGESASTKCHYLNKANKTKYIPQKRPCAPDLIRHRLSALGVLCSIFYFIVG